MRNLLLSGTAVCLFSITPAAAQLIPLYMAPNASNVYADRPVARRSARYGAYGYAPATTYGSSYGYTPGSLDNRGVFHPWPGGSVPQYRGGPRQPW